MSLFILLIFFAILYALTANAFYGNVAWTTIGLLAGLMGGKQGK